MLTILYQDDHYVAVNKPAGMLVHRTAIANDGEVVLQALRNQLRQHVYPVHRLDRPTSGVLLFALSSDAARLVGELFEHHTIDKRYLAVVRGVIGEFGTIDYPIQEEPHLPFQSAVTHYVRLGTVRLDIAVGRYPQACYSLVEVMPKTGRQHQIRKHMHHIFHPIVGDTTHGEGRHNRLFRDHFESQRLLLFATRLTFNHPFTNAAVTICAPLDSASLQLLDRLGWADAVERPG